jgi:hypothetical protein
MINQWCGSLDYELEDGIDAILGAINRRDIADGIRGLALNENPQDEKTRADMKEWLKGLTDNS